MPQGVSNNECELPDSNGDIYLDFPRSFVSGQSPDLREKPCLYILVFYHYYNKIQHT